MKRLLDITVATAGLVLLSPLLVVLSIAIWLQDYHSPFYIATRVGRGERPFRMVKFRSMVVRADKTGVDSTAGDDPRITALGRFTRRFKLDEIPQLWNVLWGSMSLVGPRPNVARETALYTPDEKRLLSVRPGITDLASIVFADEGEILQGSADPDLKYNQVIRPWKSRLGLLYVHAEPSIARDLTVILCTIKGAMDRRAALAEIQELARNLGASHELLDVMSRRGPLPAAAPPGASDIVRTRAIPA
ncbi:MAG TPA: sugar transferase [Gemmatimonadaceae bacterium]|nr:sugar transferase [Gemmatimonadaceae bacterium]